MFHKINLDKDLSSIHLPYRHRYWETNLQSMLHCLIKDHFPKKKDAIQWCFSAHLQFCFHEVPTNTGGRFTILHNHPTESPEAQIGPLLSEYLLRSSLVNWAKAPPTSSSKSLGHVPGQQWNPNMPNFTTACPSPPTAKRMEREREREQAFLMKWKCKVEVLSNERMIYLVISYDDLTGLQGLKS